MSDCIFCKIVAGEIPAYKIYEDDFVLAFLDIMPVSEGHTLVIPKKHYANLEEISEEELCKIMKVVKKVVLNNILFETGKSVLTPGSATELERLTDILEENGSE